MRNSGAMELLVYNPQKSRLETIEVEITAENTTWFKDTEKSGDIAAITDVDGCLLISTYRYDYPVLVYDLSRSDIDHNKKKARKIMREYL